MSWGGTDNSQQFGDTGQGNPFAPTAPSNNSPPRQSSHNTQKNSPDSPSDLHRDESMALGMSQNELQQHIQHNLTLIQNSIALGEGMVQMMGSTSDSASLRKRIEDVLGAVLSKIKKTAKYLSDMGASDLRKKRRGSDRQGARVAVRKKLEKDLDFLRKHLSELERTYKLKARQYSLPEPKNEGNPFSDTNSNQSSRHNSNSSSSSSSNTNSTNNNNTPSIVSGVNGLVGAEGSYVSREQVQQRLQQQMLIQGETEVNEVMINERNEAMRQVNRDLLNVREIFSDLATMVEDQDEAIEAIGENVEKSAVSAMRGRKELEKANNSQKNGCVVS